MSWLERLQTASFRGYAFLWEQVEIGGGRRVVVHEYPFQDDPYAEDMGLKAQEFRLNAYLIGTNYDQKAIAFQKLLDQKGAGELVTPVQGVMQVQLMTWTRTDTTAQGGIARFQLTFTRTGNVRYPIVELNPTSALLDRGQVLSQQVTTRFSRALITWHTLRSSAAFEVLDQIKVLLDVFAGIMGLTANGAANRVLSLLPSGDANASALLEWVDTLVTINLPAKPITWAANLPAVQGNPERQLQTALAIQATLISQIAHTIEPPHLLTAALQLHTIETAICLSLQIFDSYSQAKAVQAAINDLITFSVELPILRETLAADELNAWAALRADIAENLSQQWQVLPKVKHINVAYPLPAAVIAYRLYQNAEKVGEIVSRNQLAHPGFCWGELEYLQV